MPMKKNSVRLGANKSIVYDLVLMKEWCRTWANESIGANESTCANESTVYDVLLMIAKCTILC